MQRKTHAPFPATWFGCPYQLEENFSYLKTWGNACLPSDPMTVIVELHGLTPPLEDAKRNPLKGFRLFGDGRWVKANCIQGKCNGINYF
jgi:hypothetical protein